MNLKQLMAGGFAFAVLGAGVVMAQEATPDPLAPQLGASALLQDANGTEVGMVTLTNRADGKVVILAQVANLTPGFHGLHIHEAGACEAPFDSAGGHFNPAGTVHAEHAGDLPALLVNADGTGELMVVTDRFVLEDLLDADGSAVMIHANPDNYAHIPERYGSPDEQTLEGGDGGDRVACGVVVEDEGMTAG